MIRPDDRNRLMGCSGRILGRGIIILDWRACPIRLTAVTLEWSARPWGLQVCVRKGTCYEGTVTSSKIQINQWQHTFATASSVIIILGFIA